MAMDRQGTGLAIIRMSIGVFFIFEGLGKWRWLTDSSILANELAGWQHAVAPGSAAAAYLARVAIPFVGVFARLVPLAELCSGVALFVGFWTPFVAGIAFFMALNFLFASGALLKYSFLSNGYGLPVLGSTLGLAVGGTRLPWSIR
jgi:uncharacterized membrane protein YphA (DoxX/SURF4 family)